MDTAVVLADPRRARRCSRRISRQRAATSPTSRGAIATRRWPAAPICSTHCRSPSATRRRSGCPRSIAMPSGSPQLRPRVLVAQFGGAAGTLASLGEGDASRAAAAPSWPANSASATRRSPGTSPATASPRPCSFWRCSAGSLGKIAFDVMLMSATEFGEAAEPFVAGPRLELDDAAKAQPDLVRADPRRRQGIAPAGRARARRDGHRFRARHRPVACRMGGGARSLRLCRRRAAPVAVSARRADRRSRRAWPRTSA